MSTIARPNSEAIYRAINIYIDAMRPFILRCLAQAYGSDSVSDAVINSLSEQQADNFEIALQQNDGNVTATLDVNHFRPIVERHWDAIFAEQFGYDQTMQGTLGWITRARNDAAHPGTSDMSDSDAQDHFSNILKILRRINAVDAATAIEQIRRQLRNPSPSTSPNISTQPAMANSICANIRCQNINQYQPYISADGGVPLQCPICSAQQFVSTCIAVSCDKYGGNNSPFQYSLRIRFPNGNENVIEFYHSLNITIGRGDRLTFSVDHKDRLVYLVNENIRRWWYFPGGPKEFSGCYSKLSNWIAINTYGPEANAITYSIADVIGRMLKGHPQIPLTGRM